MNKNRQLKEAKVAEIKEKLEKAQSVVLASYQGLTVEQDTNLSKRSVTCKTSWKYQVTTIKLCILIKCNSRQKRRIC